MAAYMDEVDGMTKSFLGYDIKHVRREDNMAADTLSKLGSSRKAVPPGVCYLVMAPRKLAAGA
jgi:hypothetical protein